MQIILIFILYLLKKIKKIFIIGIDFTDELARAVILVAAY